MTREQCCKLAETVQSDVPGAPRLNVEAGKHGKSCELRVLLDETLVAYIAATNWTLVLTMFKAWALNYRFKHPVHVSLP